MTEETELPNPEQEELINHLQRLQAEFDNFRKRTEKEKKEAGALAADHLIKELLPIMDNLNLALAHAQEHESELLKGVLLIKDQLTSVLEDQGVTEVKEETFTPTLHEALTTVSHEGATPGTIINTYQTGYTRNGRVLRPARVSVAK